VAWLDSAYDKLARADVHLAALETSMHQELDATEHELIRDTETTINQSGGTTTVLSGLRFPSPPVLPPTGLS